MPGQNNGTQCIERAVILLREIASRGNCGWGLSELAKRCELDRGTAHRILKCLITERLVEQRPGNCHYLPGPLLYELGISVPRLPAFVAMCRVPLLKLARQFGGMATLILRSGDEGVHVARTGQVSFKVLTKVGDRKPLALYTGGIAILVCLPHEEALGVLDRNFQELKDLGDRRTNSIEKVFRASCESGFAIDFNEKVSGVSACGVAIRNTNAEPFAAISISGTDKEFPPNRLAEVAVALKEEIYQIESAMGDSSENGGPCIGEEGKSSSATLAGPSCSLIEMASASRSVASQPEVR